MNLCKANQDTFVYKHHFSTDSNEVVGDVMRDEPVIVIVREENEYFCLTSVGLGWIIRSRIKVLR